MSAAPSRRAISQAVVGGALVCATAALCFRAGGFFHSPRTEIAIGAWVALAAVAALPGCSAIVPPSRAGKSALAALLGLAGWTALSLAWAPLSEPAREDAIRVALYGAVLPLAVLAARERWAVRALELALAALAAVVVGYGLLGDLGAIDVTRSAGADGRLDQPIGYWNAMGAMAALGAVLSVRIAFDSTRRRGVRTAAGIAVPVLAVGLFLTYSRGALAAAALGLLVLLLLAPEAAPLWRRAGRRWRTAVAWGAAVGVAAALVLVVADRASPPHHGATAERFADLGTNRADYWRVALDSFAGQPLRGAGTAAFRVDWLRERDVEEGAFDAHSLYLETGAELGVVGLALLAAFLLGVAICARREAGRDPRLAAGACAGLAVLALHAGVDWDWELPALALPALMLAGVLLAGPRAVEP